MKVVRKLIGPEGINQFTVKRAPVVELSGLLLLLANQHATARAQLLAFLSLFVPQIEYFSFPVTVILPVTIILTGSRG